MASRASKETRTGGEGKKNEGKVGSMVSIHAYRGILPRLAEEVFIAPGAWVIGDVTIGRRSSVWFNTVVRGDETYIRIGEETNIQDNSTLHVTGDKYPLEIGNRVTIGHRAIVHGCIVEDECLIGMGAIVMDGARVGHGSLVAAGSVITSESVIPPESIVMGIPAKVIKSVTESERQRMDRSIANYLHLSREYLNPLPVAGEVRVKGFLG